MRSTNTCKRICLLAALAVSVTLPAVAQQTAHLSSVLLFQRAAGAERSFAFSPIDFPGAIDTRGIGINAGGEVVGNYLDGTGNRHGFLLSGGNFTSIDFPGALTTRANGINPEGDIVGECINTPATPGGGFHGFLLRQGAFTPVDFPGHLNTMAQRITPTGDIVGCYHDQDTMGKMHGVVVSATGFSYFSVPASMNNGVTPDGRKVAGFYTDMMTGKTRGYILVDGSFNPFDVPGSSSLRPGTLTVSARWSGSTRTVLASFMVFC